jgi:hypothetical protein
MRHRDLVDFYLPSLRLCVFYYSTQRHGERGGLVDFSLPSLRLCVFYYSTQRHGERGGLVDFSLSLLCGSAFFIIQRRGTESAEAWLIFLAFSAALRFYYSTQRRGGHRGLVNFSQPSLRLCIFYDSTRRHRDLVDFYLPSLRLCVFYYSTQRHGERGGLG